MRYYRIKNIKTIIFCCAALLCLTGCGSERTTASETETFAAVSETFAAASETEALAAAKEAETFAASEEELAQDTDTAAITYTDALSNVIEFTEQEIWEVRSGNKKVAALSGSLAEIWSLAGGRLAAVTEDAYDDASRDIEVSEETVNAGALKSPNQEILIKENIEIAFLSADIAEHAALREKLEQVGIKTVYHSVETFEDYLEVLRFYTGITGCEDRYVTYGEEVQKLIEKQLSRQDDSNPTVLFIRAFSTGAKAKGSDNMTGIMLQELGCINIADKEQRFKDDLSMEVILEKDPDYIFVTTMGSDEEAALQSVKSLLTDNPAWNSLKAVKSNHYYVLPKNMFHNKPNQRWGESYRMLADILYPENDGDAGENP